MTRKRFLVQRWNELSDSFTVLQDCLESLADARNYVIHNGRDGERYRLAYVDADGDLVYLAVVQLQFRPKEPHIADLWPLYVPHEDVFK